MSSREKRKGAQRSARGCKKQGVHGIHGRGASRDEGARPGAEGGRTPLAARGQGGRGALLAKIAEMPEWDRVMDERAHAIVAATAPALSPRTWYGMPAWAKDGDVVCFFQSAQKLRTRYATLDFSATGRASTRATALAKKAAS